MAVKKRGPKTNVPDDIWDKVRFEWEEGVMAINAIGRLYGLNESTIRTRAKRGGWKDRKKISEHTALIRAELHDYQDSQVQKAEITRVSLMTFDRVIQLLLRHRGLLHSINGSLTAQIDRVNKLISEKLAKGERFNLAQEKMIASLFKDIVDTLEKLIRMERQAFGIGPSDDPSEFDVMTPAEMDKIVATVKEALNERR